MRAKLVAVLSVFVLVSPGAVAETTTVYDRDGLIIVEPLADGSLIEHEAGLVPPVGSGVAPALVSRASTEMTLVSSRNEALNRSVLPDGGFAPITSGQPVAPYQPSYQQSPTIDRMTLRNDNFGYSPYLPIYITHLPSWYFLADGSSWRSGAGSFSRGRVVVDSVDVIGTTVTYTLVPYDSSPLIGITDYDVGDHSAVGTLYIADTLTMTATVGSDTATITGGLEIVTNAPANYNDDRFNYFSAIIGSVVPFTIDVVNDTGTWQADSFDSAISYRVIDGEVDFANPISTPAVVGIDVNGPPQVLADSQINFFAVANYDNGALADVSDEATWSLDPVGLATISTTGLLTTGAALPQDTALTISAAYDTFSASLEVTLLGADTVQLLSEQWITFQGDQGHTGSTTDIVDPQDFSLRWQAPLSTQPLHQVVEGDGRVFATIKSRFNDQPHLFAVDAIDGELIWQKGFGAVNSVNPPAFAYGTVYVQNGKPIGGAPLIHGINAATGGTVFSSPFSAQWEEYLAPTVVDGGLYVNGGYYGGMYRFNAFSGEQEWFKGLPQYDGWTPALAGDIAYGYVGGSFFALDRGTGTILYQVTDPNWGWSGYDMRGAVALANDTLAVTVHSRRLICIDVTTPQIAWDWHDDFAGQPAVSGDVIYVVNAGDLYAVDLQTGVLDWTWSAPQDLVGAVVVTATHVFTRSDNTTYAVEIGSRTSDWSYPAAGWLSIGEENLYIASDNGLLTAIAMPVISPSPPVDVELIGPDAVEENSSAEYRAMVTYEDGRVRDRTYVADWNMAANEVATISDRGELIVGELIAPTQTVDISVSYTEGDITLQDDKTIHLYTLLTNEEFAARNLESAEAVINSVLEQLEVAMRHERSAYGAVDPSSVGFTDPVEFAMSEALEHTKAAISEAEQGVFSIEQAIRLLQEMRDRSIRLPERPDVGGPGSRRTHPKGGRLVQPNQ